LINVLKLLLSFFWSCSRVDWFYILYLLLVKKKLIFLFRNSRPLLHFRTTHSKAQLLSFTVFWKKVLHVLIFLRILINGRSG